MKMKALLLATIIFPTFVYANTGSLATPFPGAKKGINIWTEEKLSTTSFTSDGYNQATWTDETVNSLFNILKTARKETNQYRSINNPLDTHLKPDVSNIELSFKFTGIPWIGKENILGFSPAGGYKKGKGWDGVVEFVQLPSLCVCSFTTFAIEKVILSKESVEYLVNKKPSEKDISGNWNVGFLYHVNWYTDTRRYSLECANKALKPENLKTMISMANQIDTSMS